MKKLLSNIYSFSSFFILLTLSCSGQENLAEKNNNIKKDNSYMQNNDYTPPYTILHNSGELKRRGENLWQRMESCDLCPRNCSANRIKGERGICKANSTLEIASFSPHYGEEPELVGRGGSGTIFFTNCALHCVFCINSEISHLGYGKTYSIDDLATIMLQLQNRGCNNINLVSPSHYIPHIILALDKAAKLGLNIPLVYNTAGWENIDVISKLDSIVDIYLSDFKYGCNNEAEKYSIGAKNYFEITSNAHIEMQRQINQTIIDEKTNLMKRGLIIRHLVMPNNAACTEKVMNWIANNLPSDTYINIMSQYTPVFNAPLYPKINRRITNTEYKKALEAAEKAGLTNVKAQGYR